MSEQVDKRFKELVADVKSPHLAVMIGLIESALRYQGNKAPLHRKSCQFRGVEFDSKDPQHSWIEGHTCTCGAFEFDGWIELYQQVERGEV